MPHPVGSPNTNILVGPHLLLFHYPGIHSTHKPSRLLPLCLFTSWFQVSSFSFIPTIICSLSSIGIDEFCLLYSYTINWQTCTFCLLREALLSNINTHSLHYPQPYIPKVDAEKDTALALSYVFATRWPHSVYL